MTYGHALELLARCACGLVAPFRNDDTGAPECRTCYETKPHWIRIERDHSDTDLLVGPYATEAAAEEALEHSLLIDDLCATDCLDAYVVPNPDAYPLDSRVDITPHVIYSGSEPSA